jgi:N12 class adenine-specific DNA methylase
VIGGAPLTAEAQATMGRYGGWGAADGVFAPGASGNDLRDRERLRAVMTRLGGSAQAGEKLFNAAGLTTLNAHYTDPLLVRAMYRSLGDLGLNQGNIAEAGVGAGHFAAFAPDGVRITGIELDPATALIAQLLHPKAEILVGSVSGPRFARIRDQSANPVRVPRDTADGFVGNVPFSEIKWPDEVLNPGQKFPLHDHAIIWGVTRVAPGGLCAFITSRYTADKPNPGFRRTLATEMDLIGMVRLPSTAHKRMAGTPVVTDIIIGRRLADGERPVTDPETWEQARSLPLPGTDLTALVNTYYHANPQHILGTISAGGMRRADDFSVEPSGDLERQLRAALGEITARALAVGQHHEPRPAARPVIEILSRRSDGTVSVNPDGTFTQVIHGQDVPLEVKDAQEADKTRRLVALAEARAALITAEGACPEDNDEIDALRARMGRLYDEYTEAYGPIGRFTVRVKNHHVKTFKTILDRLDFSKPDVPDPEIVLLEEYLGRGALTRTVKSVTDPGHVRHGTRKDKQGNDVPTETQLVLVASVRAALTAALAQVPQGADAERLAASFGERMSRIETSEERTRLMPVAFRSDPRRPSVESLENFDPVTQTATKKPAFYRRTAVPHRLELGADTPQEALDLVLIHRRRVDLGEIARLLGTDEADARKQLGTLVFEDPAAACALVAAGEYLSGNVHQKLAAARTAAAGDPRYAPNVDSLLAIQPAALGYEDIQARLGSAWLSREIVRDGLRHILDDPTITVTHPGGAGWTVSSRKGPDAENPYGTSDWSALKMAQALLTNDSIAVHRKHLDPRTGEEKSVRDDHATLYNYRRAQRLDADFVSWLWSDPDRAEQCVRLYNSTYNNQVKRKWDSSPFFIPGLAPGMRLHPFQNAAVRRLHTESGLAAWVVGAGKTELGIVAAMEGHRLGRHGLCAVTCPASLVNQWRDRIYRTYPGASVLVADDDLRARKDALEMFVERAASRDYQLAVVPYEFFGTLSLSADAARASVDEEIDKLTRYAREAAAQGDSYTAKSLQKQIARLEAQYSAVALASGGVTGFTDARITGLVIDEWHNFRRFGRDSNNREFAMDGSARGNHMLAVADHLRVHHPEGLLLGLSGTPLEQGIADAWAAMRFFDPDALKALGLEEFDAFLTTFGRTEARQEPTPTGSGLQVRERASSWFNLPEMRRVLWDPFVDVIRSADLGLNVPRITGGRPQVRVLPQTPGQAAVQAEIDDGYARFKAGDRDKDNHILRLMDRGGKNALHPRMLGMEADGDIKLEVWADEAAAWYHASKDARFLDREGNPHPVPGALRMVACELGVPDPARPNAWSVYAEMRSLLVARGVPGDKVRFAQEAAGSDRKKAALWEDARTGRCNFVIGSAQTAGTGVDVPDRLQVLDYMTLGWNPTQFEQWLGRIVRQGNQNPEVSVNVWATEGTTEVVRADKIAMKAAPFEALLDGASTTRRVTEESFNQTSAFAADMTARMSGNPLVNAQHEAQLAVDTAQGMQDEWQRENGVKARRVKTLDSEIQELEEANAAIDTALGGAVDTQGDKFAAQIGAARYTVRAEAGAALIAALAATAASDDVSALTDGNPQHLGELAGFPVTARYRRVKPELPAEPKNGQDPAPEPTLTERTWITLGLEGVPNGQVGMISGGDLPGRDPVALVTSLEGRIRRLPGDKEKNTAAIAENRDQIAKTKAELAKPSPYLHQLADARDALDRIQAEIDELIKDAAPEQETAADAEDAPASSDGPAPDASAEHVAGTAPDDIASLPPWTADSPHSAAIGTALRAALSDSDVTHVAGSNDLGRFLEWLSATGWMGGYAAASIGGDEVPPFAHAVFDDPVFAADLACAVGTVVHARCAGQAQPPGSAALRPIPPMVEMWALRHWQEHDEAIGRASGTDQWYDLVDAAGIDIWLSRAGLPRAGRQVLIDSTGHAVVELAATDGEQWRLTVPNAKDMRRETTARYMVTRSGRGGWESMLSGTPGSTRPEQAAALLIGTLTEQGALLPPAAAPGQDGVTPLPLDIAAPHRGPQPGTGPTPTQTANSSPGGDSDARAPQTDSGPLRDLAAPHSMHLSVIAGETAGLPASQPAAPVEDSLPQPLSPGMTRDELDFAYRHAYEFVLGTIRDPDQAQEERALDYAAWYMAEFGGAESLAGLPGHDHAWGWFIDRGYPARKPAALAGGQREGTRPGTGATAGASGPPGHADPQPSEVRRATLAAGLGRPETSPPPEGQAAADGSTTVPAAPDSPGQAPGLDEPGETGPYSGRVRIALESGRPVVSGTDFNDPAELREALRDNFTWRKKRQVWEYNGRNAGPEDAAQAVRDVLARLDRESAPAPAVKEFPPTPQQQAILDAFLDGKGIAVQALAGTGKTTTLVLLARALMERSPQARIVYTAFNASIVKDAKHGRFGRNVTASTMHSLARQALLQTGYAGKIEHADKGARWPEQWAEVLGIPEGTSTVTRDGAAPADAAEVARLVLATVRKFRESADGEPARQHLPYLAGPAGSPLSETVLSYARQAWADISNTGNAKALAAGRALRVEHDDYLKVWALSGPVINAEVIFFDEAQDVNDVMRAVILAQPAQTVVVGDSHQSIYGFRGAIDALKDWPADIVLPLTQSWRFGQDAAEFGNLFLRSLGSKLLLEGNPARETRLGNAPEPDAILCRTNATAVAEVFTGLESGKRTALAGGGDAIKEIAKAARDLQAGRGTKHPDLSRFADWGEVRDYARNDEDGKSLQVFVRLVDQHGPGGLIAMIDQLTPEGDTSNPPQLTISTAHKAKGLEWDVVRVAGDFRGPATDPETGEVTWPVPEERRLAYVAATRARKLLEPGSLTWIYDYPLPATRATRGPANGQDHQAQAGTPGQPEHAGQGRKPAPPAAPATPEHSTADDAPAQQTAPASATAQAPASDAAASGQIPGASGPNTGQQHPAVETDNAPAEPGQDSARPGPGNAHPDLQPPATEPGPDEDRVAPTAEPGGDRSLADGEPAAARAPGTEDGAEPGKHPAATAAARSDPGTATAASPAAADPPPEMSTAARLRALAEQYGMAVTTEQVSPTITVTTVTDSGRFVLRHDDFLGAAAEGTRIDLDEAEAYLGAWRAYPGLPALALLDWVRRDPDDPAQLSLSAARAVAAGCGLVAEPVRAAGQPFIVVRHPALSGTVLACRPGDTVASTGPVIMPVPSIGTYLRLYQAAVRPEWVTALGKRGEWASQLTAMVPYLINGTGLYSAEACRHVDAASHAAGTGDDRAVKDLLRRAWAAAGPFSPSPDREAVLLRVIGDVAPRFQEITGDGPRYAAETAHASDPEWAWIYQHVRAHPDILTAAAPTHDALEQRTAGERAQAEAEGNALSAAAKAAFDAGDYPAALDLADQGETANPGRARRWEQIRGAIREKAAAAGHALQTAIPEQSARATPGVDEPLPQPAAAAAAGPAAADASTSADTGPSMDDGARPGELSRLAVPASRDEGVRFLEELAARYGLRVHHVTDTLKWWTVHLSALDGGPGVPVAEYKGHTGEWSGFGAGRLDPSEVAAYLAARGEGDLHDAPAGSADPYTRIGQARFDYHKALLAYQALRETKAGRTLMETQDTDEPRADAIALNAAYQAISGGWKKAFAGEAEEVTGRFAAWEHAGRVMAGNLAATRHRAGIFRAALDAFTESAGHLASRTRATAEDPGETTAPGDAPPAANPATAPSGPAPVAEASPQPGRDEPAGDNPAAAPARKESEHRSYRLTRQWPDGTVRESSTTFTSLRAVAQAVAYTLADNGAASRKDAAAFASRLQDAAPGTTMTHPSGYSFTLRLVAAVAPLRNMDLGAELDRMPGQVFARWLSMGATPPAAGDLDYQRPGAGSHATVSEDGIEITVSEPDVIRHGLVTWPQAASWIDKGVTPARLGIIVTATRLGAFVEQHRDQLAAAGTCDPGAVATELAQVRATAIAAIVEAARRSRGTAVPVPPALPGDPAWHTAVPVTRPGAGPGKAENKALERLLALRSVVREPQPLTPQEVRGAIRREVSLADVARAMGDPATMRAWISDQARRTPSRSYDDSGRTWRGHGPDGLTVDRHGDDRAPHVIAWDAILAWVAPGLAGGLREELLAADDAHSAVMHREIGAVINPGTVTGPSAEEKARAGRRLRAADTAAWAAIQAAPPPSPADFDRARYAARDTSPVQDSLFGLGEVPDSADALSAAPELPSTGQPGSPAPGPAEPGEPAPGKGAQAAAAQPEPADRELPPGAADGITAPDTQAPGQRHQDDDAGRPGVIGTPAGPSREAPARDSEAEPPTEPVSNTDLVIAMRHVQGGFLRVLTEGKAPDSGGIHNWRRDGEPDARASQDIDYDPTGVEITLRGRGFRRHGRVSWAQIASWIDAGVTPARLGIILTAGRLRSAGAARGRLTVTGTGDFDAVMAELGRIREDGVNAVIDAALEAHGAAAPVPPARRGGPAFCTTAIASDPVESASDAENAALERLNQLRPLVYNPQPLTSQEVRTTIRRWISDGLPAYVKALGDPAAMRAWVAAQVRGPARRSAGMTYSTPARPGGRWYDGQPEGLRTATDVELHARMWNLIPWEEIPGWVQSGLTGSLRRRLLAAVPGKGSNEPDSLREALDAAWAAIEAAPSPSPTELDDARQVYGGASPVQPTLFGDPPADGKNTPRPAKASPAHQGETPARGPETAPGAAEPAQEQDTPAHPAVRDNDGAMATAAGPADDGGDADPAGNPAPTAGPSPDDPGSHPGTPPPGIPAPRPQAEPREVELPGAARATTLALPDGPFVPDGPVTGPETAPFPARASRAGGPAPLTDDDIVLGVSRLPASVLGELFHAADNGHPLGRAGYLLKSYSGERAVGEPDAGARETVTAVPTAPAGLHIEVAAPGGRRAGLVTWQQVDDLLRPVATPARRQVVTRACQAKISFTGADSSFRAVGESRLAAAARDELTAIAVTVVGVILEAARPSGSTGFSQFSDEAAMTGRIAELTASLPAEPPRPRTPAAEVTPGDVIGHHSYRFHPFLVTEPPRQAGDVVEITGRLTEPEPGEPAGPFTLTVPPTGRQGAVVTVIPVPAHSLRPLFPGHQVEVGADQCAPLPGPGPGEHTEAPSVPAPAPADEPQPPQPHNQEETMPPAPDSIERLPVPSAVGEPIVAPSAPPTPAPPTPATGRIQYANPARPHDHTEAPGGGANGASLTEELEPLLAALRERRGEADGTDFSDIRATFAAVRNALSLPAASQETGPGQSAPAPPTFGPDPAASQPPRREPAPAVDVFSDIRETFADLRDILGLPASGRHARGDGPLDNSDAAVASALDQAAAEAQACARWYRDTPEWQRAMTVGRAARDLVSAIRAAAGDYWAEIRQDIRVRGFARTLAARTALAVAGPAHLLAAGLERAGLQGSRPWRAAWGLHRAATTFATGVMRYDLPGSPDRMREARRMIAGLAQGQNSPAQPGPGRHAAPQGANGTRAPNAADLAGASFPVMVSRGNARQAAAAPPAARTPVPASRPHVSQRQ